MANFDKKNAKIELYVLGQFAINLLNLNSKAASPGDDRLGLWPKKIKFITYKCLQYL